MHCLRVCVCVVQGMACVCVCARVCVSNVIFGMVRLNH